MLEIPKMEPGTFCMQRRCSRSWLWPLKWTFSLSLLALQTPSWTGLETTHLSVHSSHGFGDTFHCLSHGVVRLEGLYLEGHCLDISPHHDELLDVAPCPHQVFRHDLHCILGLEKQVRDGDKGCPPMAHLHFQAHHLPLFSHLLDVSNYFLLLGFQLLPFSVQLSHGTVQSPLVLPEHLFRGFPASEQHIHCGRR